MLKKQHAYFYQVQLQIKLNNADYCDFVVWKADTVIMQRIFPDSDCIAAALNKIPSFAKLCVLPELVGKYFTKSSDDLDGPSSSVADVQALTTSVADDNHAANDNMDGFTSDDTTGDLHDSSNSVVGDDVTNYVDGSVAEDNQQDLDIDRDNSSMHTSQDDDLNSTQGLWCYCQENKGDEMVGCDNDDCPIQWFHLSCLNLTMEQLPSGDWFCPGCS